MLQSVAQWQLSTVQNPILSTGSNALHAGQMGVLNQADQFNWLAAGRRWRKSSLAAVIASSAAMEGQWILYGAPTYDQVRIVWDMVERLQVCHLNASRMMGYFKGDGKIIFRSFDDPDNARGHSADGVVIDECGFVKSMVFHQIIQPMLSDVGGWFWGMGTPNGRNWFCRECSKADDRLNAISWQIPTLGCYIENGLLVRKPHPLENPEFPWLELVDRFETTPQDIFKQEYLAEFLENEGVVFRNIKPCLNAPLDTKPKDHEGHTLVAGADWGKQQDFTVISIGCKTCKTEVALDRYNKIDYAFQRKRIIELLNKWHSPSLLPERNAMGEPVIEQLMREGVKIILGPDDKHGFQTTAVSKPPLIEDLALTFEREEWQWLDIRVATLELEAYERKLNPITARSTYGAPTGLHDDTVMARALMRRAARRSRSGIHI